MTRSTNFSKKLTFIVLLSLVALVPFFAYATDEKTTTQKEEVAQDVDTKLEEFLKVKDDATLADDEKEQKKTELRKEILAGVLKLSYTELDELRDQLTSLADLTDEEKKWQDAFSEDVNGYRAYYEDTEKKTAENASLEDIRALKTWRDGTYTPRMRTIANFVLAIQEREILKIGLERYKKIAADIAKLERGGYLNAGQFEELSTSLAQAKDHLNNAQKANARAYDLLMKKLTATTTPSSITTTSTLPVATSTAETKTATATSSTSTIQTTTPMSDISSSVQESLMQVKSAYKIFLEMSQVVKKILRL